MGIGGENEGGNYFALTSRAKERAVGIPKELIKAIHSSSDKGRSRREVDVKGRNHIDRRWRYKGWEGREGGKLGVHGINSARLI